MEGFALSLAGFASLAGALACAGRLILTDRPWPERVAMGALVLYLAVSLAGWASLLAGPVLWGILVVPVAAGILLSKKTPIRFRPPVILIVTAVILLPLAAMPQTARDAMNHHMYLPRLWLESGSIHRPGWCPFFFYPYLVESLYALVGGTFGFRAAGVVSLTGFLAAVAAAWHAASPAGRRASLMSALVVLSIPEALRNATWAYSDSFLLLFSILAAGELARKDGSPLLTALWAAAAGACKYNGLPVMAFVLLALAWKLRRQVPKLAVPLAAAILLSATWALPNALETGNPFHPLLGSLFGNAEVLDARTSELLGASSDYMASVSSPGDLLALPLRMSVQGRWDDPRLYDGASGPLILMGVLLFLLLGRNRTSILPALAVLLMTVFFSGAAVRVRYLFGAFGMLAIPAGAGLDRALSVGRPGRVAVWAAIAICLFWSGSWLARLYAAERPWEAADPSFLEKRLPYMSFYSEVDSVLEPGDTTLFVNMGNRAFYYPGYAVFNSRRFPLDILQPLWAGTDSDGLASLLRARGISHLAVDMDIADINITGELTDEEFAEWREFAALRMEPVVSLGPYVLFRLKE